jgi:hypothetical protein
VSAGPLMATKLISRSARCPGRSTGVTCDTGVRAAARIALTNPVVLTQPLTHVEDVLGEIGALIPPSVPYLLLSPWPTADPQEHGLVLIGHPPLMVRFPAPPTTPLPRWSGEVREIVLQRGSGTQRLASRPACLTTTAQMQRRCSRP